MDDSGATEPEVMVAKVPQGQGLRQVGLSSSTVPPGGWSSSLPQVTLVCGKTWQEVEQGLLGMPCTEGQGQTRHRLRMPEDVSHFPHSAEQVPRHSLLAVSGLCPDC